MVKCKEQIVNQSAGHSAIRPWFEPEHHGLCNKGRTIGHGFQEKDCSFLHVYWCVWRMSPKQRSVNQIRNFWDGNFPNAVRVTIKTIVPFVVEFLITLFFVEVSDQRKMILLLYPVLWNERSTTHGTLEIQSSLGAWGNWRPERRSSTALSPEARPPASPLGELIGCPCVVASPWFPVTYFTWVLFCWKKGNPCL